MLKKIIKNIFRSSGYVVKKLPVDNLEENLIELFRVLEINCVIDVGAHYGEYGQLLRRIGYKNRIVSFEPVTESYEILHKIASTDNNWILHNVALGRYPSTAEINVTNHSVFSSFLNPTSFSREQFGNQSETSKKEIVEITTLDSIFQDCLKGISNPRVFLKLDTQGFDLEVIGGSTISLQSISGLQSEVSVKKIYENMPDWTKAIEVYKSLGYEITGLYPVTRDANMLVIEFDCILRKDH